MEDAEGAFVGAKPSGLVRVDIHGTLARHFLLPGLPRFRGQYPDIRLHFSEAHQPLDMIREGFDCILRAGELSDSPLIKRRLALLGRGTFASPDYLGRFGTPQTPDDLTGHEMVGFLSPDSGDLVPLIFGTGDNMRQVKLPAMVTVTGPETNVACAGMGLGLIQVPRYRVTSELARGALVELLASFPPSPLPVHALYSHTRQLSPRLRVFIDWMAEQFRDRHSPTE
jgi:DNA-binding transcriptional LysR family regulator